jgi:hypothetical protein
MRAHECAREFGIDLAHTLIYRYSQIGTIDNHGP